MEEYINQVIKHCQENGIKDYKEIRKVIFDNIWEAYKGKAAKAKLEAITDDITESVVLRMGIPHEA